MQTDTSLFRPATFVELAVKNYAAALTTSAVLLAVALFAFFLNWRTAFISHRRCC